MFGRHTHAVLNTRTVLLVLDLILVLLIRFVLALVFVSVLVLFFLPLPLVLFVDVILPWAPAEFFPGGANSEGSQWLKAYLSSVCLWNTNTCCRISLLGKSLPVSLCQTLCMDSVLQKAEKQNPGSASAPPCTCLRANLYSSSYSFEPLPHRRVQMTDIATSFANPMGPIWDP